MTQHTPYQVACILPNRIGDCLLSLPAVATLASIFPHRVDVLVAPHLLPLLQQLPFPWHLKPLNVLQKIRSWVAPYDYVLHLMTSNQTLGLRSHLHAGYPIEQKPFFAFDEPLPFLDVNACKDTLPPALIHDVIDGLGCSYSVLKNMAIGPMCFEQPQAQWLETFKTQVKPFLQFKYATAAPPVLNPKWQPYLEQKQRYITLCTEVAYGSKRNGHRQWSKENWDEFFNAALELATQRGVHLLVLGTSQEPLPYQHPCLVDARRGVSLLETTYLIAQSALYVGNDSGLLHVASYTHTPSIGLYHATDVLHFGPVHRTQFTAFEGNYAVQDVVQAVEQRLLSL